MAPCSGWTRSSRRWAPPASAAPASPKETSPGGPWGEQRLWKTLRERHSKQLPSYSSDEKKSASKKKVGFLCFVVVFKYPFKPLPLKLSALWLGCSGATAVGIWSWSL